jgi:hypothetical protein
MRCHFAAILVNAACVITARQDGKAGMRGAITSKRQFAVMVGGQLVRRAHVMTASQTKKYSSIEMNAANAAQPA